MPPTPEIQNFLLELKELKQQNRELYAQNAKIIANQDTIANAMLEIARQLESFNKAVRTGTVVGNTLDGFEKLTDGVSKLLHGDDGRPLSHDDPHFRRRRRG